MSRFRVPGRLLPGVLMVLAVPLLLSAQDEGPREVRVPNPMAIHTAFIIVAVAAFLAWCISWVLDRQRDAAGGRSQREALLHQKNQLLNRIADLEAQKASLPPARYEREFRKARAQLSSVVGRLKPPSAPTTGADSGD